MARTEREDSNTVAVRTTSGSGSSTYRRRRPSEFQLPDGRKILVALPEEAAALRTKYASGEVQTEVVVHGSAEHQRFLQLAHAHHELRRAELRARHGSDFEEWENLSAQLDAVTAQLESIADHSASLKENFSKFGYDARLRTYGEEKGGGGSGAGSSSASLNEEKVDWNERQNAEAIKLFKMPVIKQYFHRGLLWRSSDESTVFSFELFFDLLYVGIIAINGDHVSEDPTGHELLRFVVTFCMSWKIWSDVAMLISWFETNDILQRIEILFLIACLLGLTTNMLQTFDEEHDTYVQLTGFYLTSRLFMAAYCALTGFLLPLVKGMMIAQVALLILGSVLWIGSTQVEMPGRLGLVFAALFVDFCGSTVYVSLFRYARNHDNKTAKKIEKFFEFYPAINIEHKVERTNAFVSLVLGYGVVGLIYQNAGSFALNAFLGKAVLGLVQSFIFNWIYFEVDGDNLHLHAIRRHANTAFLWQFSHLFFIMAYIVSAAGLSKLVVATDCADAPLHALTEFYEEKSEDEVALGIRLFYCVGLGVALFCMGLINFSHEHKIPPQCRVPHWLRLVNRAAVCIILCCLPAAQNLDSLSLISITTALTAWVLILELFGKGSKGDSLFGDDKKCQYTARCSKKDLEKAMKSDGEVDVMELGRGEKTAVPAGVE